MDEILENQPQPPIKSPEPTLHKTNVNPITLVLLIMFVTVVMIAFLFARLKFLKKNALEVNNITPTIVNRITYIPVTVSPTPFLPVLMTKNCNQENIFNPVGSPFKFSNEVKHARCNPLTGGIDISFQNTNLTIHIGYNNLDSEKKKISLSHNLSSQKDILIYTDIYGIQEPCEPKVGQDVDLRLFGFKTMTTPTGEELLISTSLIIAAPDDQKLISFLAPYSKDVTCVDSQVYKGFDVMQTYPDRMGVMIDYDKLSNEFESYYLNTNVNGKNAVTLVSDILNSVELNTDILK